LVEVSRFSKREDITDSENTEEEDGNDYEDQEEDDDFVCVPLSNMDKDTMTFKNSKQLRSARAGDRHGSARKGDSQAQLYSSDRPQTATQGQ
jgi:hypothetical protein